MIDNEENLQDNSLEEKESFQDNDKKKPDSIEDKITQMYKILEEINSKENKEENSLLSVNIFGDNANVINAKTISDSNIQSRKSNNLSNDVNDNRISLDNQNDFEEFVEKHKNTKVLTALIAIASLEIIEEENFEIVCNQLKNRINTIQPKEDWQLDSPFESRASLLKNAFLKIIKVKKNTHFGIIETNCICFTNPSMGKKIRAWLWDMYPQFRDMIIDWLISLIPSNGMFLKATIQEGIAEYSSIDFIYSVKNIFPKLSDPLDDFNISTLSASFEKIYENKDEIEIVENLLYEWICRENSDLWMVSFRVFSKGYAKKCETKINNVLRCYALGQKEPKDKYLFYIMGFAHRSDKIACGIIDVLCSEFIQQKLKANKDQIAYSFLWLLLFDMISINEQDNLVFIQKANDSILRKKMRPIIHHILSYYQMRKSLFEILESFLINHCDNRSDWTNIEKFIRELAFTGNKEDFDRIIAWLNKNQSNRQLCSFSEYMGCYLNNLLTAQKNKGDK